MDKVTVKIEGALEMERALKELGVAVANKLGKAAVEAGGRVVLKEAKRLAPRAVGSKKKKKFADTLVMRAGNEGRSLDSHTVEIGSVGQGGLSHLLEFGHAIKNQFGGPYGSVAPRPFLRPAFDSQSAKALKKIEDNLAKGIAREVAKLATKTKL
jgi:HK97 gp10 family phage protein